MKNFCAVFALCAMFFFAACSGGSKETVYDNTDSGSQSGEKNDSDNGDSQGDTTPDNGDSQHEGTDSSDSVDDSGDTVPDNSEPSDPTDDTDTSEPTDDADSSDSVSDDDADTVEEENACKNNPCQGIANSTGECIPKGTEDYSCKCKENYTWENNLCNADSRVSNCTGLPANASWNSVSSITQTWNGTEWVPSTDATFSTTESTTKCRFVCNQNYSWNDSECVAETRNANCEGLPENAVWNSAASITQTWDDENWVPSSTGTYNQNSSTTECRFKCAQNYNWNGSQCVAATNQVECTGLPENALWNTVSDITQTWSGTAWVPTNAGSFNETPSYSECRFVCKTNYSWNGVACAPNELPAVACTGKPDNAVWNSVSNITQTWNGNEWVPTTSATFSETPSTTECRFKCAENYEWNNSQCAAKTREANCTGLPTNAEWNTATKIMQTWSGNAWIPSNTGSFNSSASQSECYFKCKEHYTWNNTVCAPDTQPATCKGLPENAVWNSVSEITQTWNGNGWIPSNVGTFNASASVAECRFKCKDHYSWNSSTSKCVADTQPASCLGLPTNASWNTASSITQTWNGNAWIPSNTGTYNETPSSNECHFKCNQHYTWNSSTSTCEADTQPANCLGLPTNAVWNTTSSITQTWNGNGWTPSNTGTYNETPSSNECHYKCDSGYHWENSACISNTKTNVACTGLPTNAQWNTASSITQNWSSANGWQPSTTGTYSVTPSTNQCYYKCDSDYHWENSACISNTRTANCTGLPTNAQWNTASSITQNWDGNAWTPTTIGSFSSTPSATQCKFKCKTNYTWNNSICKANSKVSNCTGLPENAEWNTASTITQTWNGNAWIPSNAGAYNETASTEECHYKCGSGYFWNNSFCKKPIGIGNICTGQTKCYNNENAITCPSSPSADFYGQDAQYRNKCTAKSFTVQTISSQEVVLDNNTGMMWQQTIPTETYTWENAKNYCDNLTYAGYNDWRLPRPHELLTIVDNGKYDPATNPTYFPGTPSEHFWSSSTKLSSNYDAVWCADFYHGYVSAYCSKPSNYYVRCVRGTTLPASSFKSSTVNGDVIVTDTETGLIWQKTYVGGKTWQQALSYCENLTYAGYSDWRLPNNNELASLVNYGKRNPASDFPNMSTNPFIPSSTVVSNTKATWYIYFFDGNTSNNSLKTTTKSVFCVRND